MMTFKLNLFKCCPNHLLVAKISAILAFALLATFGPVRQAAAEKISNPFVEFTGLDKITGRTVNFDVRMNETVQFGTLLVTPRVCYSRPPEEPQKISGFIEVDEVTLDRNIRRIFTGWMFAASPGLNAVEHAVYDVWVVNCKIESNTLGAASSN